jgi:hypothetical protein
MNVLDPLPGAKTYILAAVYVLYLVLQYINGVEPDPMVTDSVLPLLAVTLGLKLDRSNGSSTTPS